MKRFPEYWLAAGVFTISIAAVGLSISPGVAAQPATPSASGPDVIVGKAVAISTDAAGSITSQGSYTATNLSGTGSAKVTVPMGPNKPVDLSSFSWLQKQNGSVVYDVANSGDQVKQLIASGGQFKGQLPVTFSVELLVNGKRVDPKTATSITGDVELTYNFTNHTNEVTPLTYLDANGNQATINANVAIPFSIALDTTLGSGWANVTAPWANNGFSTGEVVTGGTTMMPSALNDWNPNAKLTIKAKAQNAQLSAVNIVLIPMSTSAAVTSGLSKGSGAGTKLTQVLEGTGIPLLLEVQSAMGKASGDIAALLKQKVNPILDLLSKLSLDPNKANAAVKKGGAVIAGLGDLLVGINSATQGAGAQLSNVLASLSSPGTQKNLDAVADELGGVGTKLDLLVAALPKLADGLRVGAADLSKPVPAIAVSSVCPTGKTTCTFGQAIDANLVDKLSSTCTTGQDTNNLLSDPAYLAALQQGIDASSGATAANLTTLKKLLAAQATAGIPPPPGCTDAAKAMEAALDGMFGSLGEVGDDLDGLLPLLTTLDKGINDTAVGLKKLSAALPRINAALDRPCGARSVFDNLSSCGMIQLLDLVSKANGAASKQLEQRVTNIVTEIEPMVTKLFGIANIFGKAALPLERQLNELPAVINQLAYGNVGQLVTGAEGLAGLAEKLTNAASQQAAVNTAIDTKFNAGVGFPYGAASGGGAATTAVYSYTVAAATVGIASLAVTASFAILLLLLCGAAAIWLHLRRRNRLV